MTVHANLVFETRFLYSFSWPEICYVEQADLDLRDLPGFALKSAGVKACGTTSSYVPIF